MIVHGMGQSLIFTLIPMLGRQLRLDELTVTLPFTTVAWTPKELAITSLSSVTALVVSMFSPVWGRVSDRSGRKGVVIVGLVGYAVGALLFALAVLVGLLDWVSSMTLWLLLVLTRAIHASLVAAAHPAANAYMADVTTPQQRTRGIGAVNAATQIGVMAGPALIYFVALHLLAPMVIHAVVMLLCGWLVWARLPAARPTSAVQQAQRRPPLRLTDRRFRGFLTVGFSMYLLLAVAQSTLAFYIQDTFNLDLGTAARYFSVALVFSSGAMVVAQYLLVQRLGWSPPRLLQIGLPTVAVGYLGIALAQNLPWFYASMTLFGFGMGVSVPGYMAGASLSVEADEQGAMAGITGAVGSFAYLFGPLLGGWFYSLHHQSPYLIAAALLIPLSIFTFRLRVRRHA